MPIRTSSNVEGAKERWESVLAKDREQMTEYERIEVEQDVEGKNLLADLEPRVTIGMGLQNLKQELARLQQEHLSGSRKADVDTTIASSSAHAGTKHSRSPSAEKRILSSPFIVENEETLLRFIRADRLDAQKAAQRMLNYYSLAMELFGENMLQRPILLDDFDRAERRILESGWVQLLLTRDVQGRRIMAIDDTGSSDPTNTVHKVSQNDMQRSEIAKQ